MLIKLTSLIFLSFAASAHAAPDCTDAFVREGISIPGSLVRLGYSSVAGINLNNLIAEIRVVEVRGSTQKKVQAANRDGLSDGRATARWETRPNGVSISVACERWSRIPSRDVMALHEYFGALGYEDGEYWASVSLWTLAQPEIQSHLTEAEKRSLVNFVRTVSGQRIASNRGGVVVVGGGGEGMSALYRIMRVQNAIKALTRARTDDDRTAAIDMLRAALLSRGTVYVGTPR